MLSLFVREVLALCLLLMETRYFSVLLLFFCGYVSRVSSHGMASLLLFFSFLYLYTKSKCEKPHSMFLSLSFFFTNKKNDNQLVMKCQENMKWWMCLCISVLLHRRKYLVFVSKWDSYDISFDFFRGLLYLNFFITLSKSIFKIVNNSLIMTTLFRWGCIVYFLGKFENKIKIFE